MSTTLATYITEVRRLLHDAIGAFWTDSELTDYINDARNRVVRDSGCLRTIQKANISANTESYIFSSVFPNGNITMDIINVNLLWGSSRQPLFYLPWTDFNSRLRYWQNYIGRPIAFTLYGPTTIYFGPSPDQTYTVEADTVIMPAPLVNTTDVDNIPDPWTGPVMFYVAHLAKYKEQSYGEAEIFMQKYKEKMQNVLAGTFTRRQFSPYITIY